MTAKETINKYMDAWKNQQWKQMMDSCQITWQHRVQKKLKALRGYCDILKIVSYTVVNEVPISGIDNNLCTDFIVNITYRAQESPANIKTKTLVARLIKEDAPFKPSKSGKWGVNPISTLREAKECQLSAVV